MKNMHILSIALLALLLSACSALIPFAGTKSTGSNQTVQNSEPAARNSVEDAAENKSALKANNAFADSENENTNRAKPKSVAQQRNAVCPVPDKPCQHKEKEFAEWELSFQLPAKIAPNKTYSSAPFYAVLLKTHKSEEDCDGGEFIEALESERKEVQNLQLERKVFAAYGCPNMDAVNYDFEGRWDKAKEMVLIDNFIAVYAGETEEEAEVLRRSMRDEYPKAVIKKMTANWERIEQ